MAEQIKLSLMVFLTIALGACGSDGAQEVATPIGQVADAQSGAPGVRTPVRPVQAGDSYYVSAAEAVAARVGDSAPGTAKNVILFVGDGMGISTITAARIHAGQLAGQDGESHRLTMETLPHAALSKTYAHDAQVADSAATATAMVAGIKAPARTLGVLQDASFGNCASGEGRGTDTLFELAERAGLATGLVSTARLTHATPASTYAETVSRDWEDDGDVPGNGAANGCPDIARQFIDWSEGDHFEIALAGGRRHFLNKATTDPERADQSGARGDGANLVTEWEAKSDSHIAVFDAEGLASADLSNGARVLGLFEPSHMQYELDRAGDTGGEPSIEEMTRAAIARLQQDPDGYVLMVEGGRIDHGHHGASAIRALTDTIAFDEAIAAAIEMTSDEDTLIIVTADHSHTLTIQGYQPRNHPILGKVTYPGGEPALLPDGKPYTTLSYANGPSACLPVNGEPCAREDLSEVDTAASEFRQQALLPMPSETHAGEDVAIFAGGPGAELVRGVMEQNEIFHVMGQASGLVAPISED